MNLNQHLKNSFLAGREALDQFLADEAAMERVGEFASRLAAAFENGNQAIIFGNGGSACDATHFAEEFTGRYRKERRPLPVIAVNDGGHLTCVANDYGFEEVFSRSVDAFARKGDVVIGISTSGNSENVRRAMQVASERGCTTVALLGKDGGKIAGSCDLEWIVPGKTTDRIQEIHMMILHIVIEGVERILFPENY